MRRRPPRTRLNCRWVPPTKPASSSTVSRPPTSTAPTPPHPASRAAGAAGGPGRAVAGIGSSTGGGAVVGRGPDVGAVAHAEPRSAATSRVATIPTSAIRPRNGFPPAKVARFRRSAHDTASSRPGNVEKDGGGGMIDIDRILAERYDRRGFMRMAGATTLGAAVLAAGKKAETRGGVTGPSGGPGVHPPLEQ